MIILSSPLAGFSIVLNSWMTQLTMFLAQLVYAVLFLMDPPRYDDPALEVQV